MADEHPEREALRAEDQRLRSVATELEREGEQLRGSGNVDALRVYADRRKAYHQELNRYLDRFWRYHNRSQGTA